MDRARFFEKLTARISREQRTADASQSQLNAARQAAIEQIKAILRQYQTNLEHCGLVVQSMGLDDDGQFVEMKLIYKDGHHHGLQISDGMLRSVFTKGDGQNYSSQGPNADLSRSFSAQAFDLFVQSMIEDFLFYAERHGGYK